MTTRLLERVRAAAKRVEARVQSTTLYGSDLLSIRTDLAFMCESLDKLCGSTDDVEDAAFRRGAEAAAGLAGEYNGSTTHPYRLDDCILGKLNMREGKPRKNTRALRRESK